MNPEHHNDEAVTIADVYSEIEASTLVAILRDEGIEAHAVGGPVSGFRAEAPGHARVLVPRRQAEDAHRVLVEARDEAKNINWDEIDVGEFEN